MPTLDRPDARARPPESIQRAYKMLQKLKAADDLQGPPAMTPDSDLVEIEPHSIAALPSHLRQVFLDFLQATGERESQPNGQDIPSFESGKVLQVAHVPGLYIYPSLLPPPVQLHLLHQLLHRDLSSPSHLTNVDLHYDVPRPSHTSYFHPDSSPDAFQPLDPEVHRPITNQQFLNKKLRWITLGGQYDWTEKLYPPTSPPPFPADIKRLIEDVFPVKAEAAIVNLYSPGDTLALHRDVSEECDRPLVSLSLGCEGIFVVGLDAEEEEEEVGEPRMAVLRLKSGDAVLMSGASRYAWHGVPKVLEGTCPGWMGEWPTVDGGEGGEYGKWKGWMAGKRVNLNVRQMFA